MMTTDLQDSSAEIVMCHEEIEALRATNADLLEALEYIALNHSEDGWGVFPPDAYQKAAEAIAKGE